jgi:hypothetical protein
VDIGLEPGDEQIREALIEILNGTIDSETTM